MWYYSSSTDGDRGDPDLLTARAEFTPCDYILIPYYSSHDHTRYVEKGRELLLVDLCCGDQAEKRFGHGESEFIYER